MNIIRHQQEVALSNRDLTDFLRLHGLSTKISLYPEVCRARHIDDLLDPETGTGILLIESRPSYGHWCCLTRGTRGNHPDLLEFFNSYGNSSGKAGKNSFGGWPDDAVARVLEMNPEFAKSVNEDKPYLSRLMIESGYPLSYNEFRLQGSAPDIRTCGRHCLARILFRDMPLEEYVVELRQCAKKMNTTPDGIVTILTSDVGF